MIAFEDRPLNFDAWDINIYYNDKPYPVDDVTSWRVVEEGPLRGGVEIVRRYGASTITQRILIHADLPCIDFPTRVDWRERQTLLKAAFPVTVNCPRHVRHPVGQRRAGRYALGWTGSGLGLAASLSWLDQRYHWTRRLYGAPVALDRAFRAGVFDLADRLVTNPDGTWAEEETAAEGRTVPVYEIHARHYDTLPLPYLHAFWGLLTAEEGLHSMQVQAIRRYSAAQPGCLQAYLCARGHTLRWIEDRIGELGRNSQIVKRPLELARLSTLDLDASSVARANRDFMRLEHHLALGRWLAARLSPPGARLPAGRPVPVKRVRAIAENTVAAELNLAPCSWT